MVCYALRRFSWKGSNVQAVQGVGVGLAGLRRSLTFFSHALRRHMLITLEIPNRDKAFEWFLAWQAQANLAAKAARFIRSHELSLETRYRQHANGSSVSVLPRPCCRLVRAATSSVPPPSFRHPVVPLIRAAPTSVLPSSSLPLARCPHPCRCLVCAAALLPPPSVSPSSVPPPCPCRPPRPCRWPTALVPAAALVPATCLVPATRLVCPHSLTILTCP